MKTNILKNKNTYIIGLIFLLFVAQWSYYNNKNLEIITKAKQVINEEKGKKSVEEILIDLSQEFTTRSETSLNEINSHKEQIKILEQEYEFNELSKRCIQEQLKRVSENEEIDGEYCKQEENLEQFRNAKKKQ